MSSDKSAVEGVTLQSRQTLWLQHKRKLQFQVMCCVHKHVASPDDVYEQQKQRFLGLLQKLLDIRKSLEHYRMAALPLYCSACASLGADVWCVVGVDAVGKGAEAEKFRHAMCAINETKEAKNHFFNADAVLSGAVRFLDIHINAMKSVQSQIAYRKDVKLEFDRYEQKLGKLRKCTKSTRMSLQRLERNEQKLVKARAALKSVTVELYRVFAKYESERDTMLNGELEMVRQVMHNFYAKNADATNYLIPDEVDRSIVDARAEQLFKSMVDKEDEQDALKVLTNSHRTSSSYTVANDGSASSSGATSVIVTTSSLDEEEKTLTITSLGSEPDALSEKLKTIQLSRPSIQPIKYRLGRPAAITGQAQRHSQ